MNDYVPRRAREEAEADAPTAAYEIVPEADSAPKVLRYMLIAAGVAFALVIGACVWFFNPSQPTASMQRQETPPAPTPEVTLPSVAPVASEPPAPSTAATSRPPDRVAAVRAVIQAQLAARRLSADVARELNTRLDDISRQLARGQTRQAERAIDGMRDRLRDLRRDDRLSAEAYNAIVASLGKLSV